MCEKEKMLVHSIVSFPHNVFQSSLSQGHKKRRSYGGRVQHSIYIHGPTIFMRYVTNLAGPEVCLYGKSQTGIAHLPSTMSGKRQKFNKKWLRFFSWISNFPMLASPLTSCINQYNIWKHCEKISIDCLMQCMNFIQFVPVFEFKCTSPQEVEVIHAIVFFLWEGIRHLSERRIIPILCQSI